MKIGDCKGTHIKFLPIVSYESDIILSSSQFGDLE